ncbi:hypothetical protein HJFPF1_04907 [Paramyrothecium foliicola]|nr:hypothetical protein HJFPF1_04907 [Paramyrothecium foliicola]
MDRPPPQVGSVRRARERALAGLPRDPMQLQPPQMIYEEPQSDRTSLPSYRGVPASKVPKPRAPVGLSGNINQAISRPTPVPQWPLAGPLQSPVESRNVRPFRPPQGQGQPAPQRPPRPSVVPSILDQSRVQEPTPVFLAPNTPTDNSRAVSQDYGSSAPLTPSSRLTVSSVGSIPDFPVPATTTASLAPPRKSVNLGPPPSSRRGLSSFYSTTSYVSPIPEESAGSRSHGSYASSAAMPDTWGQPSSATSSTFQDAFYEESISDDSRDSQFIEEYGDESSLVRSASVGKKGKPSIITTKPTNAGQPASRPGAAPVQGDQGESSQFDVSTSSSNTLPMAKPTPAEVRQSLMSSNDPGVKSAAILGAFAAATAPSPIEPPSSTPVPLNAADKAAARRLPKLDIDAVRAAEARGSLTSLPDLIRRATRLAAMIDGGKRPASRFEDLGDFPSDRFEEKEPPSDRRRSGLSDMLAAFPPPVQTTREPRPLRGSWFRGTSWPLAPGRQEAPPGPSRLAQSPEMGGQSKEGTIKPARRCCGLPMWAFILVVVLGLAVIAVAIVIPLQFFVFKTLGNQNNADQSLEQCRTTLVCKNGGTNVISQGVCSCICTNGFSGPDCTGDRSDACTTTNLVSSDASKNIQDVTLGRAIPRLIAEASANFSIPLSGTTILAKLNSGSLSCIAQNSLVTFNRQSTRIGDGSAAVQDVDEASGEVPLNLAGPPISFISLHPGESLTFDPPRTTSSPTPSSAPGTTEQPSTVTPPPAPPPSSLPPTITTSNPPTASPTLISAFTITEEMLDFGRVAVLFVLQEQTAESAVTAQTNLQRFFSEVQRDGMRGGGGDKRTEALDLAIGGNNRINLIAFTVDLGNGPVGRSISKRTALVHQQVRSRRGGSGLPIL